MLSRVFVLAAAAVAVVSAQEADWPAQSGEITCEGLTRPDWAECDTLKPQLFGYSTAGPKFAQGTVVTGTKCRLRIVQCAGFAENEFQVYNGANMVQLVENVCAEYDTGGIYRSGDACAVVDDPTNEIFPVITKRDSSDTEGSEDAASEASDPSTRSISAASGASGMHEKQRRRELVAEAQNLEQRQCNPPPEPCYSYNQGIFLDNVRGPQQKVCDNILPDGARCDQTKSVTTTQTFSVGFEVGVGIEDVVSAGASFGFETSTSSTESITTAITIDCPNGGYVVWYPLMQVSRGECYKGRNTCSHGCISEERTQCEMWRPITPGNGRLSGEYDIQCL